MKLCPYEDCDEQILDWQETCYLHKNIKGETQMNENNYGNPQPQMPQAQQPTPQPQTDFGYAPQRPVPQQQVQPKEEPVVYNSQGDQIPKSNEKSGDVIVGEIPELSDRDRLIVKQVAFKSAIDVYLQMNADVEINDYDTMLGELQRLTVDFFKIIVAKNEQEK